MNETLEGVVADPPARQQGAKPATPPECAGSRRTPGGLLTWFSRVLPTFFVLVTMVAIGYWGHHTGWKLPKLSELNGSAQATAEDWCSEHDVPESICVECKSSLLPRDKDFGFCKEHGVHQCPLCHPEVAQLKETPIISEAELLRVKGALNVIERPENNPKCPLFRRRIQFASDEAVKAAGLDIALAEVQPMVEAVSANGEITYDQTRVARLGVPVSGAVWAVEKSKGQRVAPGDVLFVVNAPRVGEVKAEFLQAMAEAELEKNNVARLRPLAGGGIPRKDLVAAEGRLRAATVRLAAAEQSLVNLGLPIRAAELNNLTVADLARAVQLIGLPESLVERLDPETATGNLLPVKAPFAGIVVHRDIVPGEYIESGKVSFIVADVSQMWLALNVRQEDAKHLALGQRVRFQPTGGGGEAVGEVSLIDTVVDERTRTVGVRADLANTEERLRAGTFGQGHIVLREEQKAVVVPHEAVHWDGSCNAVFVRDKRYFDKDGYKVFHTRTVRPGTKDGKFTEIIAGVLPGEVIASTGSGILRASLLKNNLGAG